MDKDLFVKLLKTPSISGHELHIQRLLIDELKDVDDEVITHHSYNCVHVVNKDAKIKVMLLAHIDEIGLVINKIEENGICKLTNVGAIKPQMYTGQHVNVVKYNKDNTITYIPGVIGYTPNYNDGSLKVEDLNLDLGTFSKEQTQKLVEIGDSVLCQDRVTFLQNDLIASRALDDKIATFICVEVLKQIKEKSKNGVYFVSTVGEETTSRGAIFSTVDVIPTVAIALDVGSSSDVKYRNDFTRETALSKGPLFTITSNGNEILLDKLKQIAKENNIPYQMVVEISKTYTDFDDVYKARGGIPSTLISIPLRYMHSSCEVGSLKDVEYIIKLLVEFISSLTSDDTFDPFKE